MTVPIPLHADRARFMDTMPAPPAGACNHTLGVRALRAAGSAVVVADAPIAHVHRTAADDGGRPSMAVAPTGAIEGRRSTGPRPTAGAACSAVVLSERHRDLQTRLGDMPTGTASWWATREKQLPTGNISTLPVYLHLRIVRTPRKDSPAVANTRHPLEIQVAEMHTTLNKFMKIALRDDVLDAEEREVQDCIRRHKEEIAAFNIRRQAGDSFARNGFSRHTDDLMKQADAHLVDLNVERQARRPNIIQFPTQRNEAS